MLIDIHTHTSIGSDCSIPHPEDLIVLTFFEDQIRNEEKLILAIKERKFHAENNLGLGNPVLS